VLSGEVFHVRIRCDRTQAIPLTNQKLADLLLKSVKQYHVNGRWHARLFLLMPDHLHALLSFPPDRTMSTVIRSWKAYHARCNGVEWQSGYFDHRIRNAKELDAKWDYIRQNPFVKEL
jgi:putative transposase